MPVTVTEAFCIGMVLGMATITLAMQVVGLL